MRNKLKNYILILFYFFLISKNVYANEPFVFNITEIEILEDGNKIYGYKGGTAISEDGSTIIAENFFYNKLTNILETSGNVKYLDKIKNVIITSDKAIYIKNEEKIFALGNSKAANNKNNEFTTPLFLFKAGQTAMELKKFDKAEALFTKIYKEYSKSDQGREIEKYIAAAKYAN